MLKPIIVTLVIAAAQPALAGQSFRAPGSPSTFGAQRPRSSDPYRKLFETQTALKQAVETATLKAGTKPQQVCGLTMIPADPTIDPKMLFPRKADGVDYKIRVITPPVCNPSR